MWCLHELPQEYDRIAQVGSHDNYVDETPDDLPILHRLTRGARVFMQLQVAVERG